MIEDLKKTKKIIFPFKYQVFLPSFSDKQPTEIDRVKKVVRYSQIIDIGYDPLSELQFLCITSMVLAALFPDCARRPVNNCTIRSISGNKY